MNIKKLIINISIFILIIIIVFVGYKIIFSNGGEEPTGGNLVPQGFLSTDRDTNNSAQFLDILESVRDISFDTSVFSRPAFGTLQDFSVDLIAKPRGRTNPFAPIGVGNINNEEISTSTEEVSFEEDEEVEGFGDIEGLEEDFEDF